MLSCSRFLRFAIVRSMSCNIKRLDSYIPRHIGPRQEQLKSMLDVVKAGSLDALIDETVPACIRLQKPLSFAQRPLTESEATAELKAITDQNKVCRSHIGAGFFGTIMPPVIARNMLCNPAYYTAYTPYQAEISQGRMEMLLNYQTMVADLTGLPWANASLLDEATAAAEAMFMCFSHVGGDANKKNVFLVCSDVHPHVMDVVKTRASGLGITVKLIEGAAAADTDFKDACGLLMQYPNTYGAVRDLSLLVKQAHAAGGALVACATDLLALCVLTPPGEWGADICIGSTQRFGLPMGYGGPHAGFMSVADAIKRRMPGRILGLSRDSRGLPALRMALQTREQHIRREKATSNICTSQALLANLSAAYAIYHGPQGLRRIALNAHTAACTFARGLQSMTFKLRVEEGSFFDTVCVDLNGAGNAQAYIEAAEKQCINLRLVDANTICVSFDETSEAQHVDELWRVFAQVKGVAAPPSSAAEVCGTLAGDTCFPAAFVRKTPYLTHAVFNTHHSETGMMRYLQYLASKDLSLATAMIPLGSCTMKLNSALVMQPLEWPSISSLHPFAPDAQTAGMRSMIRFVEDSLCNITQLSGCTLMPNSGAQGEYTGLMVIKAFLNSIGQSHRNICLIPSSAHGTNPASCSMAGLKVVTVQCDAKGNVDVADLAAKAKQLGPNVAALMVTYPSTHGVFESRIKEIVDIVHSIGAQVYMDGANMNAQVGLTAPGFIGADVCHLNLHKTFAIPHGGGGPGMGPICVAKHLVPFLPRHVSRPQQQRTSIGAVSAAPFGSASILSITWMYLKMMGVEGVTQATKFAILNANYMAERLAPHYKILYRGEKGRVAHEFIIDLREFVPKGVKAEDVAKRLLDFSFHAPTVSFPIPDTLMVEPTESEPLSELDRLCDALIHIRSEIDLVISGKIDKQDNMLKNAPHTADMVSASVWTHPYSREVAAYPLPYLKQFKFWPQVGRVDNVYGDTHLSCTLPHSCC